MLDTLYITLISIKISLPVAITSKLSMLLFTNYNSAKEEVIRISKSRINKVKVTIYTYLYRL